MDIVTEEILTETTKLNQDVCEQYFLRFHSSNGCVNVNFFCRSALTINSEFSVKVIYERD